MTEKKIYALGFFDGVHRGHIALLEECRRLASNSGAEVGVVTFTGHPDTLVLGSTPKLINTPADRQRLLRQQGVETVIALPFDKNMMEMPWMDFFRLLVDRYHAAGFVCGNDFRFGYRGEGSAEKLKTLCDASGLPCAVVPEQTVDDVRVSSTHIRNLLAAGEMEQAIRFLGHPHILTGTVVSGRRIGRTIGVPTANIRIPEGIIVPRSGVYACMAEADGRVHPAVTNVGSRPTVGGHHITVESWILDFDGDLYGQELTVQFHKFLRPEEKFPSLEALRAEIQKNAAETRKFFGK